MLGVPRSQEEARQQGCSESARESTNKRLLNEDMKERPAATIAQRIRFLESVRECHGEASELLERLASVEAPGMEPKKRVVGAASERDEWLRAAWRVMVSAQVDPERGWCSWMRWGPILRFLPSTLGRQKAAELTARGSAQPREEHDTTL